MFNNSDSMFSVSWVLVLLLVLLLLIMMIITIINIITIITIITIIIQDPGSRKLPRPRGPPRATTSGRTSS